MGMSLNTQTNMVTNKIKHQNGILPNNVDLLVEKQMKTWSNKKAYKYAVKKEWSKQQACWISLLDLLVKIQTNMVKNQKGGQKKKCQQKNHVKKESGEKERGPRPPNRRALRPFGPSALRAACGPAAGKSLGRKRSAQLAAQRLGLGGCGARNTPRGSRLEARGSRLEARGSEEGPSRAWVGGGLGGLVGGRWGRCGGGGSKQGAGNVRVVWGGGGWWDFPVVRVRQKGKPTQKKIRPTLRSSTRVESVLVVDIRRRSP